MEIDSEAISDFPGNGNDSEWCIPKKPTIVDSSWKDVESVSDVTEIRQFGGDILPGEGLMSWKVFFSEMEMVNWTKKW